MKSGMVKRILAMVMMVMLLAGDLIPSLADTISGGDAVVVDAVVTTEEQVVNPEVAADVTVNTNDSADSEADTQIPEETVVEEAVVEIFEEETPTAETPAEEVVEEEVVEEETEEVEVEEEVSVSDGDAEIEEELEEIVLETEVNGVVITLTAPAGSLPENAELWAEEITQTADNKEQLEVIDEALETEAEKQEIEVQKYKAFDIKIMVNGEAVQPSEEVKVAFTGDILLPQKEEESVTVYHVTDDAVANDVSAVVTDDAVEMATDHFSVYVIAVATDASNTECTVTINHYLAEDEEKTEKQAFYADEEYTIAKGQQLKVSAQGGNDYTVSKVLVKVNGEIIETITDNTQEEINIEITDNSEIELYYEPTVDNNYRSDVTYFDYSVMSNGAFLQESTQSLWWGVKVSGEINGTTYTDIEYHTEGKFYTGDNVVLTIAAGDVFKNVTITADGNVSTTDAATVVAQGGGFALTYLVEKESSAYKAGINSYGVGHENEFLAMGQTGTFHNYELWIEKNGTSLNANVNNATNGSNVENAIIPNLVTGLTSDYKDVITGPGVYEPGYFNTNPLEGKTIYSDRFELKFNREGHKYVLTSSVDNVAGKETLAGISNPNFFPLNDVPYADTMEAVGAAGVSNISLTKGNAFFGMRYDISFSIGDYVGPLEYTFGGDDDLWVFVDGHRVLDLGGLHQAYAAAYSNPLEATTVDLWKATDANGNLLINPEEKDKEHQITVLYMERGAWDSTCYMEFIIPNARAMQSVITEKPGGNVEFVKVDSESKAALQGAVFGLFKEDHQSVVATAVSGADGKVSFVNIKAGQYYVKEISAPEGYVLNTTEYAVTVESGKTSTVNGGTIENTAKPKTIDLKFRKVEHGDLNNKLVGAEFVLTSANDASFRMTAVSGADGLFTFENIPEGVYYLTETKAPEGFVLPNVPWVVRVAAFEGVDSDSYWGHGTVYDEAAGLQYRINGGEGPTGLWQSHQVDGVMYIKNDRPTNFEFTKVDAETKAPMKDVEFTLYSDLSAEMTAKTATAVSDENGKVVFENLADGNYLLVETPVEGYVAAGPWILSVLNNDGKYTLTLYDAEYIEAKNAYAIVQGSAYEAMVIENTPDKPELGALVITKTVDEVNLVHGEATFIFKIEGPEGEVLYRTITFDEEVTNGAAKSVTISNLPVGTYKVTELKTLRYTCKSATEQTKEVVADQTTYYDFENEKVFDNYYSHSDVKVNVVTFERDENGNIIGSNISQKITSDNN